jgi:glycerol kinase
MEELKSKWKIDRKFEPDQHREPFKEVIANWRKAVERSKGWYDVR